MFFFSSFFSSQNAFSLSNLKVLNTDQSKWIDDNRRKVYKLIAETPPHGPEFSAAVKHLLKRQAGPRHMDQSSPQLSSIRSRGRLDLATWTRVLGSCQASAQKVGQAPSHGPELSAAVKLLGMAKTPSSCGGNSSQVTSPYTWRPPWTARRATRRGPSLRIERPRTWFNVSSERPDTSSIDTLQLIILRKRAEKMLKNSINY